MLQPDPIVPPKKKAARKTTKSKTGTLRIRKSRAMPSKTAQRYGTRRELLRNLTNHELGWCTDDNLLYIKIGKALRPVASGGGGGGTDIEIKGVSNQVVVKKDSSTGKDVYTISLAGAVIDAQVPPPPTTGAAGKVLTANDGGSFTWQDPPVKSTSTIDL